MSSRVFQKQEISDLYCTRQSGTFCRIGTYCHFIYPVHHFYLPFWSGARTEIFNILGNLILPAGRPDKFWFLWLNIICNLQLESVPVWSAVCILVGISVTYLVYFVYLCWVEIICADQWESKFLSLPLKSCAQANQSINFSKGKIK